MFITYICSLGKDNPMARDKSSVKKGSKQRKNQSEKQKVILVPPSNDERFYWFSKKPKLTTQSS